jgi:enoyl-CoA hydratase/carnithine racemase
LPLNYQHISSIREGDFQVVTMRLAKRRNALSESHLRELLDAFQLVGSSDARGVILAAEGPVFSAGHDFRDIAERDLAGMHDLLGVCRQFIETIPQIPQVVIAQVEGLATAGGCQLVASCDLAVAGASSRFAVPGGKGGWFCTTPGVALARAVGRKRALEMLLTGDPIDAATAYSLGLVNRVVPDGAVAEATRELLRRATRGSAQSKGVGKRAFYQQVDLDTRRAYDLATEVMAASSQTADAREGVSAFLEKRRARFDRAQTTSNDKR